MIKVEKGSLWIFDSIIIWPSTASPEICDENGLLIKRVESRKLIVILDIIGDAKNGWVKVLHENTIGYIQRRVLKTCCRRV